MKNNESNRATGQGFPRRVFLAHGTRLVTLGGLGALTAALGWPEAAQGQDWKTLSRSGKQGGYGIVKKLTAPATAAGRKLKKGSRVESGEEIRVAPKGHLVLSLSDNTIMRINGNTTVTLQIGGNRTGFFRLAVGSLLTVMPTRNRYLVQLPTTVIGIKGTVFFQQIYHPDERVAVGMEEKRYTIPEGVKEYFCLCNGEADFLAKASMNTFFVDQAQHHNSYFLDPRLPNPLVKAPMVNHADTQIQDLIDRQDGPKHKSQFLDANTYGESY